MGIYLNPGNGDLTEGTPERWEVIPVKSCLWGETMIRITEINRTIA